MKTTKTTSSGDITFNLRNDRGKLDARGLSLVAALAVMFMSLGTFPAEAKPLKQISKTENVVVDRVETMALNGEVAMVSPNSISILEKSKKSGELDREVVFFVDDAVVLQNFESMADLEVGDRVYISYEESVWTEGEKERIERVTKSIRFLNKAGGARVLAT